MLKILLSKTKKNLEIFGLVLFFIFLKTGSDLSSNIKGISILIGLIAASQLKKHFGYKIGMFFIAGFFSGIVSLAMYWGSLLIYNKFVDLTDFSTERQKLITNILNLNSKMPITIDNESEIIGLSSLNNKTITMRIRAKNYTKKEILTRYSNDVSQFEDEMLKDELKNSCSNNDIKNMISVGIEINMLYLGSDNNQIGNIKINDEKCKLHY